MKAPPPQTSNSRLEPPQVNRASAQLSASRAAAAASKPFTAVLRALRQWAIKQKLPPVFEAPVDVTAFPTYLDVVKEPMWLQRIDEKIAAGAYDGNAGALRRDLLLIGSNCIAFNANNPWWFALGNNWCTAVEKCYHDAVGKHEAKRAADAKRLEAWRAGAEQRKPCIEL